MTWNIIFKFQGLIINNLSKCCYLETAHDMYVYRCFSQFNKNTNHLETLIKCRFWFIRSGWDLRSYFSNKLPHVPRLQFHGLHFSQKDLHRTNGKAGPGIKFPVVATRQWFKRRRKLYLKQLLRKKDVSGKEVTQKWQRKDDKVCVMCLNKLGSWHVNRKKALLQINKYFYLLGDLNTY